MVASWERLTSVTADGNTSAGAGLSTGTFTPKKYMKVKMYIMSSTDMQFRVGTGGTIDTGSNYSARNSNAGGSDNTDASATHAQLGSFSSNANGAWAECDIINVAGEEKVFIQHTVSIPSTGAGTAPYRTENVSKWTNTSGQINIMAFQTASAVIYDGSFITVWGADDQPSTPFYPNLPNGAIFEDTTDGNHYMWDGTDTWNEVT